VYIGNAFPLFVRKKSYNVPTRRQRKKQRACNAQIIETIEATKVTLERYRTAHDSRTFNRMGESKEGNMSMGTFPDANVMGIPFVDYKKVAANKIVFALFVSWEEETQPRDRVSRAVECSRVISRVEARWPGAAVFIGRTKGFSRWKLSGFGYDAVLVLRRQLSTIGEVTTQLEECLPGRKVKWYERTVVQRHVEHGVWLKHVLDFCEQGGETYGSRVVLERGDAETVAMLEELTSEERCDGGNSEWMKQLTARMHWS
jgi:hypothetical protein